MKYFLRNNEPEYLFELELDNPIDLNEYFEGDCEEIQDYIRETALEKAQSEIEEMPKGIFDDADQLGDSIFNLSDKNVREHIDGKLCYVTVDNEGNNASIPLILPEDVYELGRYDGDGFSIVTGSTILMMVEQFLKNGLWQEGFLSIEGNICDKEYITCVLDDGKIIWRDKEGNLLLPIIWFGLPNENPIPIWCLYGDNNTFNQERIAEFCTESEWKSFWFNDFWVMDWEALFDGNEEIYTIWMFNECGMVEPTDLFEGVRAQCPISLNPEDSYDQFAQKIDNYFEEKYGKTQGILRKNE